jgi:ribulose-5-phosphate 4-epimerase/fuculose-1-phosphate aldolase
VGIVEEDYSGLASTEDRVRPMADALAKQRAIILPNHGAVTGGANIQQAIIMMLLLEGMAARNLSVMMMSAGGPGPQPKPIHPEVALATKKELAGLKALGMVWEDLMAKLRKSDPELFA